MEVAFRINLYRGQNEVKNRDHDMDVPDNVNKVPDNIDEVPDNTDKMPDNTDKVPNTTWKLPDSVSKMPDMTAELPDTTVELPDNEQEQQIYKYVLKNGSITTAETAEFLGVKHRRARAVLMNMVEDAYLRKEGAARSTIYVKQ